VAEVCVDGSHMAVTRQRQTYDDLVNLDVSPGW
jgi:hypothetical protein